MLFHNFAVQLYNMKRIFLWLSGAMLLLASCNQYNNVMKTADYDYKYEAAKEYFVKGQYFLYFPVKSIIIPPSENHSY